MKKLLTLQELEQIWSDLFFAAPLPNSFGVSTTISRECAEKLQNHIEALEDKIERLEDGRD